MGEGERVDHVLFFQPAFAGGVHSGMDEGELVGCVGVGIDAAEEPFFRGSVPKAPVEVHPGWVSVQFDDFFVGNAGVDDFLQVDCVGLSLEKEAAGGVAQDCGEGMFDGAEDPFGHGFLVLLERRVDGGDHKVEFFEDFIGKIERAVGKNVALRAGEDIGAELF